MLCMYSVDNRKRLNVYHNAACDGSIKCTEIIWAQGYAWDGYKFWDGPHVLNIKRLTTNVLLRLKLVEYINLICRILVMTDLKDLYTYKWFKDLWTDRWIYI